MLVCLDCFKVYNQKAIKNNTCKVKDCHGNVIEIDELFVPVIIELNKKGYKTNYCCSGHYTESKPNSYLYFKDYVNLPNLPNGYMFDENLYPDVDWDKYVGKKTIRRLFNEKKSLNELSKDIFNNAIEVLEWAERLPEM